MKNLTGEVLDGRYRLESLLGEGGMGQVYVGTQVMTGRKVAVKFLLPELSNNTEAVERFYREARAATAIGSQHICEVIDIRPPEAGSPFLVMELLEGETLKDRIKRLGRLPLEEAVNIMLQVLEALHAAHKAGIVHRDIKPENVFLVNRGPDQPLLVKLLDFGISKFNPTGGEDHSLTRTGTVLGTPYYMSPEQASGDRGVGPQSDLYAVGVMLYEVITGSVPFDAESFSALVVKIVTEVPLHPCQRVPELPQAMGDLIMKSMARAAQYRFNTAKDMAEALRAVASGQSIDIAPVHASDSSFEAIQVSGTSGVSSAFPRTQIQHGGSGISGTSGATQTPMSFERTGETKPRMWLFVGGGALVMVLLIVGVGGFLVLPRLLEGEPPPPPPVVTTPTNPGSTTTGDTTQAATTGPTAAVDAGVAEATGSSDAGAQPMAQEAGPRTVTVTYAIAPTNATIYLDDRELQGGAAGTVELPADGARHVIKASAHGHNDESYEFQATEDTRIAFSLTTRRRTGSTSRGHTTQPTKTGTTTTRSTKRGSNVVTGVVTPEGW